MPISFDDSESIEALEIGWCVRSELIAGGQIEFVADRTDWMDFPNGGLYAVRYPRADEVWLDAYTLGDAVVLNKR